MKTTFTNEKSANPTTDQRSINNEDKSSSVTITEFNSLYNLHQRLGHQIEDYCKNYHKRDKSMNYMKYGVIIGTIESLIITMESEVNGVSNA